jgi:sugar phosphate isomerase/epimerase
MNIEEQNLPAAVRYAGSRLGLFHVADSNRRGIGKGHTEFAGVFDALKDIDYRGPVIFEMSPPGPDPFTPVKDGDYLTALEQELGSSISWIQRNIMAA